MSAEKESTSFFGLLNMRLGVSLSVFGSMLPRDLFKIAYLFSLAK
jgi:hypothetical protein